MNLSTNLTHLHRLRLHIHNSQSFPRKPSLSTDSSSLEFPIHLRLLSLRDGGPRLLFHRRVSDNIADRFDTHYVPASSQKPEQKHASFLDILGSANSILPHVTIISTILAFVNPTPYTWFTSRYYAPTLGFMMFAIGLNLKEKDFTEAFKRPAPILVGYVCQFVLKPFLGFLFGTISMSFLGLPMALSAGIMLTSCVSGAQLSNYATFLTDPSMAPLSIVMTSLSTASAVFVTPFLSKLLLGKRLPVDVGGMVSNILQIIVSPVAVSLLLNRFFPQVSSAVRPFLPPISLVVNFFCIGAPLAINMDSILSPFGTSVALLMIMFHSSSFIIGYAFTGVLFHKEPDVKPLQRTISFETGMQSSLLAVTLANKFFQDPLVSVAPAISVVIMSLMSFSLVLVWSKKKKIAIAPKSI